jgi:hypothetical protein
LKGVRGEPVSSVRDMGVELHGELGRGVPGPTLHHPWVDAGVDHRRDRHMPERMERQARVEAGTLDGGGEDAFPEPSPEHASPRPDEDERFRIIAGYRSVGGEVMRKLVDEERLEHITRFALVLSLPCTRVARQRSLAGTLMYHLEATSMHGANE